ncbi:MAG: Dabb family protein [Verrucomicrobiota bacterium]
MSKVKHIALIKFKEGTSEEQIENVFAQLLDLTENVEGVVDYVSGPNSSPEGLSLGMTHGFIMTFTDAASRDVYLTHPEHERVKVNVMPLIESVVIFDFEV